MDAFFRKRTLTLYWIVLVVHCVFMYFELPYIAVTKPMFVPLLLLHIIAYVMAISLTVLTAVNAAGVEKYRTVALNYLIPGAIIFVIEHIIVALNKFHLGRSNNLYIAGIITYCWTQYLFVKGVLKAYL